MYIIYTVSQTFRICVTFSCDHFDGGVSVRGPGVVAKVGIGELGGRERRLHGGIGR